MSLFKRLSKTPGDASVSKKDYEKLSVKLLKRAEECAKKGDMSDAAWLYQRLSVLARRAGEWDDGIRYALQSAEYNEREGSPFNAGWSYRSAALAAKSKGDHKLTVEYALKGVEKFKQSKSIYAAQWCYKTAALASKEAGKPDRAIKLYEHACKIEEDEDLRNEVNRLKHSVSHPRVDQYADKGEVVEGEKVRFEVVVENHSQVTLKNIVIGDRDARMTHEIETLKPGEIRLFSYETSGRIGRVRSPYNFITWKNDEGERLDFEIEPITVRVRPRIQVTPHIHPDPVVNKVCKLVILMKNMSSTPLYDIKVDVDFAENVKAPHQNPKEYEKLSPGDEYGSAWSMKTAVPGKHGIADGKITMFDENGTKYEEDIPPIAAEVLETERPAAKPEKEPAPQKPHLDSTITAYHIDEKHYAELEKRFFHQHRGYTFRGIKGGIVLKHVMENCRDMELVSQHRFEQEAMLLYSFRLGEKHNLLTVVIKKDEDFVHLVLKLYSESREGLVENLGRIADIIRHTIVAETDVHEVEKVEIKKVINIIDSVVQRSRIGTGEEGETKKKDVKVRDSVVQRTDV
jgi:tetratricopeptide (TPR) repeat protein